jgi:hypothetical protein
MNIILKNTWLHESLYIIILIIRKEITIVIFIIGEDITDKTITNVLNIVF